MTNDQLASAEAYYKAFNDKDLQGIARRLHPDVQFVAPMGESSGKEKVVEAAKRLLSILKGITIRAEFESGNQVMLAYDLTYGEPMELCRSAVLMTFKDSLISRIELFYDARPFGNL